jgi:uncharacterized protein (UPF0276 family)
MHLTETLGATYSYRRRYFHETLKLPETVRALEVIVDHFLPLTKERKKEINQLRDRFILLPHSLNASLGSAEGLSRRHLHNIGEVVQYMKAPFWSDHLAFTQSGNIKIGHMAPMPFTREALDVLVRNIGNAQAEVNLPIIVENASATFAWGDAEYDEVAFLETLCREAQIKLLFDLANLQSSVSSPTSIIDGLDPSLVQILHIAGGYRIDGIYVDAHDRPVEENVWQLLERACHRFKPLAIIVERDTYLPPFSDIQLEIERAEQCLRGKG